MTSFEYDMDLSKGLMPQIQAIIAPPISEDTQRAQRRTRDLSHPYFRRPGKGHNRDLCDACGEGGDLLCCDKCPASFHLQCHDPPLEESDIPPGQFFCNSCAYNKSLSEKQGQSKPSTSNSNGNAKNVTDSESSQVRQGLDILIAAAAASNPKQFELPRELSLPVIFPGDDKVQPKGRRTLANQRKRTHELDASGLVPLPAKVCYHCSKSCRKAPLIACDYCSLFWHQDCLNPPLTSLPTGMWMCPNHPEHFLDKRLNTCSATERVRLWDRYAGPIDQDAIKIEFVRKARRLHYLYPGGTNFRFRSKILAPRNRVRVPDSIIQQYKFPQSLAPSLRDLIRENHQILTAPRPTQDEQDTWLSGLVSLQLGLASRMIKNNNNESCTITEIKPEICPNCRKNKSHETNSSDELEMSDICSCSLISNSLTNGDYHVNGILESTNDDVFNKTLINKMSTSSKQNNSLIKYINSKMLKDESSNINSSSSINLIFDLNKEQDLDLSNLDQRLVYLLASQRLQELNRSDHCFSNSSTNLKIEDKPLKSTSETSSPNDNNVKFTNVKATISQLTTEGLCLPLLGNSFTIGTGSDMDLCLSLHGFCKNVSPKHAVIYYDKDTAHYELLNYSEHGTTVDNVLYSCDLIDRCSSQEKDDESDKKIREQRKLMREIVDKHQKKKQKEDPSKYNNNKSTKRIPVYQQLMTPSSSVFCNCTKTSTKSMNSNHTGWEGSAVLYHGCHIKFGCQQYIFSINDQKSTYYLDTIKAIKDSLPE